MAKEIKLAVQKRAAAGSSAARRLRRSGWLPAVVCNNKGRAESVQINARDFEKILHQRRGENILFDLTVDGGTDRRVLLREVQRDPVLDEVIHADFVEVSMTRKMRVGIQIRLLGEPVGVSQQGGILEQVLRELEVECLPGDIVESIDVDVSGLNLNQAIPVRDLKVDPKLTVLTSGDLAVATVTEPRKEEEITPEVAAVVEGAEPEVLTAKKEEGEEGAEGEEKAEKGEKGEKKPAAGKEPEKGEKGEKGEKKPAVRKEPERAEKGDRKPTGERKPKGKEKS